eukprot:TRINITY_DN3391_c0_g1_i2.p1 TRINITY_DN3391_c0_g1~~TRINITY_DN3391_c0_g1_i2.p1  ORF type:complete len:422 (+),score=50.95 TRINITY_DN3391_c0_g1_i2:33-1298(+)
MSPRRFLLLSLIALLAALPCQASNTTTRSFLTPAIELSPGGVNDDYHVMLLPAGHIGITGYAADIVDENGNSVPLTEVYLHHFAAVLYHVDKEYDPSQAREADRFWEEKQFKMMGNSGLCTSLFFTYGFGAESRRTPSKLPEPYAVEVGNVNKVPEGKREVWLLQVHIIDLRGTETPKGCLECHCDLYNTTADEWGNKLADGYAGGFRCCYTGRTCKLKPGFSGEKRKYYMRYNVTYAEWNECSKPADMFLLDTTSDITGINCEVEYDIPACDPNAPLKECTHTLENRFRFPYSGHIIYGVGHQHYGGMGITLLNENDEAICDSIPTYGRGEGAGNEAGYVVGMGGCSAKPDDLENPVAKLTENQTLKLRSVYNRLGGHIGVMSLFILGVDKHPEQSLPAHCNAQGLLQQPGRKGLTKAHF